MALAAGGCVRDACRAVGMSFASAYALRSRPAAIAFRAAWEAALDFAMSRLEDAALARAIQGVPRPVFYRGEQVGEWREHDERLAMFLLRYRRPQRFGSQLDRLPPPPPPLRAPGIDCVEPDIEQAIGRLDWELGDLVDFGDLPAPMDETPRAIEGVNFINIDGDRDGDRDGDCAGDCGGGGGPVEPAP